MGCRHRLASSTLVILFITITTRNCVEIAKFYGVLCWGTLCLWLTCMIFCLRGTDQPHNLATSSELPDARAALGMTHKLSGRFFPRKSNF